MTTKENYERWLNSSKVDAQTKAQLKAMNKEEIDDAFFKDVEFGTAGMRGVLGPGTNRLNDFTVKKATVAFGKYLLEIFPNAKKEGVVISHDNRHMSRDFTLLSAKVLNDLGISVIYGSDISHKAPCLTIINGSIAHINLNKGKFNIKFELK